MDSEGRVWADLNGQRRCLFQAKAGSAIYRFGNGGTRHIDASIGEVQLEGDRLILTLQL